MNNRANWILGGALAISATVAYVAVPRILLVSDFAMMLWNSDAVRTDRGWHVEKPDGSTLDLQKPAGDATRPFTLEAFIDGAALAKIVLTDDIEWASVDSLKLRFSDTARADSSAWYWFDLTGELVVTRTSGFTQVGGSPLYKVELSNSASFDSVLAFETTPRVSSFGRLGPAPWFIRAMAWEDSTKQWHFPSPTVRLVP